MFSLKDLFSQEKSLKVKLLVAMLILTLTFANVLLLGMYISTGTFGTEGSLRGQGNATNVPNVLFDVSFNINDRSLNDVRRDINEQELVLYAQVRVEGRRSTK